jgi:hypothetical protein
MILLGRAMTFGRALFSQLGAAAISGGIGITNRAEHHRPIGLLQAVRNLFAGQLLRVYAASKRLDAFRLAKVGKLAGISGTEDRAPYSRKSSPRVSLESSEPCPPGFAGGASRYASTSLVARRERPMANRPVLARATSNHISSGFAADLIGPQGSRVYG